MRKLLTTTAALAAALITPVLSSPSGLWDHNGSAMRLVYNNGHFGVYYEIVRPGLVQTIPPGSPRFEGTRTGNQITGNAFVYTKYCPGALKRQGREFCRQYPTDQVCDPGESPPPPARKRRA